jgi:hypothetical protein
MNFALWRKWQQQGSRAWRTAHTVPVCNVEKGPFSTIDVATRWLVLLRWKFQRGACMSRAARVFSKDFAPSGNHQSIDRLSTIRSSSFFSTDATHLACVAVKDRLLGGLGRG